MLVAVIFLLAMLVLSLSIALPRVRDDIKRDRELETMQRGKQYTRAIQLYYRKFGAYPPTLDALVKTNDIRFLRKRYIDPMTGKDDWRPIHFGENKTPTAMGFFGQAAPVSTLAGTGPSGGNGLTSSTGSTTGSSMFGGSSVGSSIFAPSSGTDTSAGTTAGASASGTDTSGSTTTGSSSGISGTSGQTFGGAGIIGFAPASPKQSILVYKKKNHFNEWEFLYDPIADRKTISSGGGAGGTSATSITTPVTSTTSTSSSSSSTAQQ